MIRGMLEQRVEQHFIDSADLGYQLAQALGKPVAAAIQALLSCVTGGGKVLACGDAGSAALATYFATLFQSGFERGRPGLGALVLGPEAGAAPGETASSEGPARAVRALGQAGDVLLLISGDGRAPALVNAVEAAHDRDMSVVALTGAGGGELARRLRETDAHVGVPHERLARVREVHLLALHALCDGVDLQLLGEPENSP